MALLCKGSVGTVMLGFLAEGLFIPLLAAYLITLVVGLAFAALHRDHDGAGRRTRVRKNSR
jgi:hypothetical protein